MKIKEQYTGAAPAPVTTVYFIRHAEPNYANHDDETRELTEKGRCDRLLARDYLRGVPIDAVLSSPYRRAVDTVLPIAEERGLSVEMVDDFRERRVGSWIDDFDSFCRRQWCDFTYCMADGESLCEVQERNVRALRILLSRYLGKTIVVGAHGTALSTLIHAYHPAFGYTDFCAIQSLMPWMVKFVFCDRTLLEWRSIKDFLI